MTKHRKEIWLSECDYIGAIGVDSVEEFAELALTDPDVRDALTGQSEPTLEQVMTALTVAYDVEALKIPAIIAHQERWPTDKVYDIAIDEKVGRGYVKVLGVHL